MLSADEVRASLLPHQREALQAIVDGKLAWITRGELLRADVLPEDVDELVKLGLAEWWSPPVVGPNRLRQPLATLTVWGAHVARVELDERFILDGEEALEVPYWVGLGNGSDCVVLPQHARCCRLPLPEMVPDRESEPDPDDESPFLLDEWTGEPIRLFAGHAPKINGDLKGGLGSSRGGLFGGVPIERDRKGGRSHKAFA
jgi:hypothetical protein